MRLVLQLEEGDAASLGLLRATPGWEACSTPDLVWARGPAGESESKACLRLPCLARFHETEGGGLVPVGATLPVAVMPGGPWRPLPLFLGLAAGEPLACVGVQPVSYPGLERDAIPRDPAALRLPLQALAAWADLAPSVRMNPLVFALSADGWAFVRGHPLPSIEGEPWWFEGPLAMPCGWNLPAGVRAEWICGNLGLRPEDWALLTADGAVEVVRAEFRLPLRRSALRAAASASTGAAPWGT